jgi:hypothetical protein
MNHTLMHFGAASKKTLDFSGNVWWDAFLVALKRIYIVW